MLTSLSMYSRSRTWFPFSETRSSVFRAAHAALTRCERPPGSATGLYTPVYFSRNQEPVDPFSTPSIRCKRPLRARALRHKGASVCGSVHAQSAGAVADLLAPRSRAARPSRAASAAFSSGARRMGAREQSGASGGFAPAHSGTKAPSFAALTLHPRSPAGAVAAAVGQSAHCRRRRPSRAASAAFSSGARRMGAREQSGVSTASRPRTPAKGASVCGSDPTPRSPAGAVAAAVGKPRIAGAGAQAEPQAQRFPAERVGWVPGAIRCIGGIAPAHSGKRRLRLRL
jgi:hypothetical protein